MDLWALAELKESFAYRSKSNRPNSFIYHDQYGCSCPSVGVFMHGGVCPFLLWACHCPKWVCLHLHHSLTTTSRHDSHSVNEIGVGRFYFKQQDLKETCSFPFSHLLIKTSVSDLLLSLVLSRVTAVDGAPQGHWAGPLFHLSKCLFPPHFSLFFTPVNCSLAFRFLYR